MPKRAEPLSPSTVTNAKPKAKPVKIPDGRGMFLLVNPDGSKLWRFRYRRPGAGTENMLSLGTYPEVSLKEARERREAARALLANGVDPGVQRQAQKRATEQQPLSAFEVIAREWFTKQKTLWAVGHAEKVIRRLERDLFPWIGRRPIEEITAPELLQQLERIEQRGAIETAHRALQNFGQVARYAVRTGRATRDISADLRGALTPWRPTQYAHAVEPEQIAAQLRKIAECTGTFPVLCALRLVPLLFARTGELRRMRWSDLDLDSCQWTYTVSKTRRQHIACLSRQALAILRDLQPLTGFHEYVFPGSGRQRNLPISSNAILGALRRAGVSKEEQTIHGYRHTASVLLNEMSVWNPDAIEAALTHKMPGVRGVYAGRAQYLEERRRMMQAWADYLESLIAGINPSS